MTRQGKRDARNVRVLQRMFMQEQARTIDSKAGASLLAQADLMNGPDYKTRAYETLNEFLTHRTGNRGHAYEMQNHTNYLNCASCNIEKPRQELREVNGRLLCHRC